MSFTIMISEISALAGRHKYITADQAIINHMLNYEHNFCKMAKEKRSNKTLETNMIIINDTNILTLTELENIKKLESSIISTINQNDSEQSIKDNLAKLCINTSIKPEKLFGVVCEKKALESHQLRSYCENLNFKEQPHLKQTWKHKTVNVKDIKINIGGKIDSIYINGNGEYLIVENKNRKNKLWDYNPNYDIDQLSFYMFIWNTDHGIIHQYHNGKSKIDKYSNQSKIVNTILNSETFYNSITKISNYLKSSDTEMIQFANTYF